MSSVIFAQRQTRFDVCKTTMKTCRRIAATPKLPQLLQRFASSTVNMEVHLSHLQLIVNRCLDNVTKKSQNLALFFTFFYLNF